MFREIGCYLNTKYTQKKYQNPASMRCDPGIIEILNREAALCRFHTRKIVLDFRICFRYFYATLIART
jgi:hypothetical protein